MPPIRYTLPNNNNSNKNNSVGLAAAAAAAAKKKSEEENTHDDDDDAVASRDNKSEQVPITSTETVAAAAAAAAVAAVATTAKETAKDTAEDNENPNDEAGRNNKNEPVPIIKIDEAAVTATATATTTEAADDSTPTAVVVAAVAAVRAIAKVKAKEIVDKINQINVTNSNENDKTGGGGDGSDTYWRYVDKFMEEMDPSIRDALPLRYQPTGASASSKENIFFEVLFHPKKLGIMLSTRNEVRNVVVANTNQGGNNSTNSDAFDDDDNKAVVVSTITNELYKNRVILGDEVVSINNRNVMNHSLYDITNIVLSTTKRPISITFLRTISTTIPPRVPDNKTGGNDSAWRYVDNFMEVMDPLIRDSLPLRYQPAGATSKENIFFEILFRPKKLGIVLSERKNTPTTTTMKDEEQDDSMKQNAGGGGAAAGNKGDVSVIVSSISNELYKNRVALGDEIVSINETNVMNKSLYLITNMILSTKKRPISITFLRTTTIQKAVRSSSLLAVAAAVAAAAPEAEVVPPPSMLLVNNDDEMGTKKNNTENKYVKSESKMVEITKKQLIEYDTMKYMVGQMQSIMVKARDAKNTYDKRAFVESVVLAISDGKCFICVCVCVCVFTLCGY